MLTEWLAFSVIDAVVLGSFRYCWVMSRNIFWYCLRCCLGIYYYWKLASLLCWLLHLVFLFYIWEVCFLTTISHFGWCAGCSSVSCLLQVWSSLLATAPLGGVSQVQPFYSVYRKFVFINVNSIQTGTLQAHPLLQFSLKVFFSNNIKPLLCDHMFFQLKIIPSSRKTVWIW